MTVEILKNETFSLKISHFFVPNYFIFLSSEEFFLAFDIFYLLYFHFYIFSFQHSGKRENYNFDIIFREIELLGFKRAVEGIWSDHKSPAKMMPSS